MSEPTIADMMRHVCDNLSGEGVSSFSFTPYDMAYHTAKVEAAKHDITDEEQIENAAANWVDTHPGDIKAKFKTPFASPTITRHFEKSGRFVKVTLGKNETYDPEITVTILDSAPVKRTRGRPRNESQPEQVSQIPEALVNWQPDITKIKPEHLEAFQLFVGEYREFVSSLIGE